MARLGDNEVRQNTGNIGFVELSCKRKKIKIFLQQTRLGTVTRGVLLAMPQTGKLAETLTFSLRKES